MWKEYHDGNFKDTLPPNLNSVCSIVWKIEKNTWERVDMEFLFERSEQEKSTLLMNEIKGSTLGRIKIVKCAGSLKTKTCVGSLQKKKKKLGLIFNIQNSQLVNWYWPKKKKSFGYTAKIGLLQIFKLLVFVLSREKCHYQSHWIRNFRFFFSYFGVPPLLGKVWTSPSVSDTDFSVFYQPMDWERRTLFHSFINLIE